MSELIEILQYEWAWRALLASSMVGLMCGLLGCFIVLRNMALIGDALSHAILPGVVIAFVFVGHSIVGFFIGSVIAGLISAVAITWIQHQAKTKNDAAIGIVFTAMFSIGVIGISWLSRNEGVHLDLKDFLFGNVLGVENEDLWLTSATCFYVILSIVVFYRYFFISTFQPTIAQTMGISVKLIHYYLMLLLSFAVVAALQTVGVILVVAMLITPASTALLLTNRLNRVLILSAVIGVISAILGLIAAILFETTPGPAMAIVTTLFYLLALLAAPERGIIAKKIIQIRVTEKIRNEHVLKESLKLAKNNKLSFESLLEKLDISHSKLKSQIVKLKKLGFFESSSKLQLSLDGKNKASGLVRAHRLWETYLVDQIGLDETQIHDDADRYEHYLSDEILDEVDATLGFPTKDPHGSPIPPKFGQPESPLANFDLGAYVKITARQLSDEVVKKLWKLGIQPERTLYIKSFLDLEIILKDGEEELSVSKDLARATNAIAVSKES